jgi:concentrative nucleoside transporter, CNT family
VDNTHIPITPVDARSEPPSTPMSWRLAIAAGICIIAGAAYLLQSTISSQGQAAAGVVFFFGLVAAFSSNLRQVNWRTIVWGIGLQCLLAVLVLKVSVVRQAFAMVGFGVKQFISFSDEGATFVFGNLADPKSNEFFFAFRVLPPILFVSAFFTVLYHFGILQWCVRLFARAMVYLMGTSGAETLSVSANVFMGQTEAPLIVKPYVLRMTNSELFTLMTSGFAHISGALMIVYINTYGADPVAVLTTCVMACPCSLYLAKLYLPETGAPETAGKLHTSHEKSPYVNAIDAAASGTSDGLRLALNVAAMLIVFIAFVAMFDAMISGIKPALKWLGIFGDLPDWPDDLGLKDVFGWLFSPAAFLMGVDMDDVNKVGGLLGTKLALNEHVAYFNMKKLFDLNPAYMTERSRQLTAFALTGFANFASVGIQLGGIGAMAPERRHDLARLGGRALFVGFVATLLNAAIAGVLL